MECAGCRRRKEKERLHRITYVTAQSTALLEKQTTAQP
jgi:predicted RNA-binding protein YlxR (DUF448 family)